MALEVLFIGDVQRTTQNLVIARVDADRQLILVRGAVPGCANGEVINNDTQKGIRNTVYTIAQTERSGKHERLNSDRE